MKKKTGITKHAKQRSKQRQGFSTKALRKMASKAYTTGHPPESFQGSFKRYLYFLSLNRRGWTTVRVYGEHVYIFREETLVTVLNVPNRFKKLLKKLKKEKDNDHKKRKPRYIRERHEFS